MAFADALLARWDGQGERLPDKVSELRGPRHGTVVLPTHLTWHGLREFDVSEEEPRLLLYSIVLSNGRRGDVTRYVNGPLLVADWPRLSAMLGRKLRSTCERRLRLGDGR